MPRVYIQESSEADCDDFIQAAHASRDLHGPHFKLPLTPEDFAKYLTRYQADNHISYLVRNAESRQLVGVVSANHILFDWLQSAHLAYGVFEGHSRKGLMTEALALVITDLFDRVSLHRVEANIQPTNEPSIKLVKRVGLSKEGLAPKHMLVAGEWRDHERWSLTKENWPREQR